MLSILFVVLFFILFLSVFIGILKTQPTGFVIKDFKLLENNDYNLKDAIFFSTFCLTLIKMFFGYFPILVNISILSSLTFYACLNNYYIQFQYLFTRLILFIMPKHLFVDRDNTLDAFIFEFEGDLELQKPWKELKNITIFQKMWFHIFLHLIWLRLAFLYKPIFMTVIYVMIIVFLIFNKLPFLILTYELHSFIYLNFVWIYLAYLF